MPGFTLTGPGTRPAAAPRKREKPPLAPLKPSRCNWYRVTADGQWAFERRDDDGTTWTVTHLPSRTLTCTCLGSLRQCRTYTASGAASEDLQQIQAGAPPENTQTAKETS